MCNIPVSGTLQAGDNVAPYNQVRCESKKIPLRFTDDVFIFHANVDMMSIRLYLQAWGELEHARQLLCRFKANFHER